MKIGNFPGALVLILFLPSVVGAQGGPPLATDDPGTPGDGHTESNLAIQTQISGSGAQYQIPSLDLNYGWGEHIQLNLNISWILAAQDGEATQNGGSLASLGTKWRFVDEDRAGVAVSTYPRVDFHSPLSSDRSLINVPGSRYFIPIEVSKQIGRVGLNPELGYAWYSESASEWVYGFAASYELGDEREMLAELHGRKKTGADDRELFAQLGTRIALTNHCRFIGALGRSVAVYPDSTGYWLVYAGFQIHY